MKRKLVYVAHPFGGDEKNREALRKEIADMVRQMPDADNYIFLNPLDFFISVADVQDDDAVLKQCLDLLMRCDGVIFCGNWRKSRGARLEHLISSVLKMRRWEGTAEFLTDEKF